MSALVVVMGYCVLSALLGLALITVSQRDSRTKREIADQMAQARQAKHVRGVVEETTRRSAGLRRLRHDLANQVRVVAGLVNEGRYDDADRYLEALQAQAHALQGASTRDTPAQQASDGMQFADTNTLAFGSE